MPSVRPSSFKKNKSDFVRIGKGYYVRKSSIRILWYDTTPGKNDYSAYIDGNTNVVTMTRELFFLVADALGIVIEEQQEPA